MRLLHRLLDLWRAPSRKFHALIWAVALYGAQSVAGYVLTRNQFAHVYPPEGDSIGIPLMSMFFGHALMYPVMLIAMALLRGDWLMKLFGYTTFMVLIGVFLLEAVSWADPRHYEIAIAMCAVITIVILYLVREWQRPTTAV